MDFVKFNYQWKLIFISLHQYHSYYNSKRPHQCFSESCLLTFTRYAIKAWTSLLWRRSSCSCAPLLISLLMVWQCWDLHLYSFQEACNYYRKCLRNPYHLFVNRFFSVLLFKVCFQVFYIASFTMNFYPISIQRIIWPFYTFLFDWCDLWLEFNFNNQYF